MAKQVLAQAAGQGGRRDTAFDLALDEIRHRVISLQHEMTEQEAEARLEAKPLGDMAPLLVLSRGLRIVQDGNAIRLAIREYPYLAYALMDPRLLSTVRRIKEEISRNQEARSALLALGTIPQPIPLSNERTVVNTSHSARESA